MIRKSRSRTNLMIMDEGVSSIAEVVGVCAHINETLSESFALASETLPSFDSLEEFSEFCCNSVKNLPDSMIEYFGSKYLAQATSRGQSDL